MRDYDRVRFGPIVSIFPTIPIPIFYRFPFRVSSTTSLKPDRLHPSRYKILTFETYLERVFEKLFPYLTYITSLKYPFNNL